MEGELEWELHDGIRLCSDVTVWGHPCSPEKLTGLPIWTSVECCVGLLLVPYFGEQTFVRVSPEKVHAA